MLVNDCIHIIGWSIAWLLASIIYNILKQLWIFMISFYVTNLYVWSISNLRITSYTSSSHLRACHPLNIFFIICGLISNLRLFLISPIWRSINWKWIIPLSMLKRRLWCIFIIYLWVLYLWEIRLRIATYITNFVWLICLLICKWKVLNIRDRLRRLFKSFLKKSFFWCSFFRSWSDDVISWIKKVFFTVLHLTILLVLYLVRLDYLIRLACLL